MSRSEDIVNLFRQFDGDPSTYREMGRDNRAIDARERWPLLAALEVGEIAAHVASVAGRADVAYARQVDHDAQRWRADAMKSEKTSMAATLPVRSLHLFEPTGLPELPIQRDISPSPSVAARFLAMPDPAFQAVPSQASWDAAPSNRSSAGVQAEAPIEKGDDALSTVFQRLRGQSEPLGEAAAAEHPNDDALLRKLLRP